MKLDILKKKVVILIFIIALLTAVVATYLLYCLLCSCNFNTGQDKLDVTPYQVNEKISLRKEVLSLNDIELSSPRQITSNGDMLFICDSGNSRIVRCNAQGNSIKVLGQPGSIQGEFVEPTCIASSDTQICVYDRGSDRIQVLTFDGDPIWEFCLDDEFDFYSEVVDVEMCSDGSVYFSLLTFNNHTGSSGIYLLKNGELTEIIRYTVGSLHNNKDNIYYMSKYELLDDNTWITGYAEMLKIADEKYERVAAFSDCFSAVGLECFNERLYVYDSCSQSVNVVNMTGEYIETVFSEPVVNDFSYNGFCGDKNGNFYLCDTNGNTVYKLVKND